MATTFKNKKLKKTLQSLEASWELSYNWQNFVSLNFILILQLIAHLFLIKLSANILLSKDQNFGSIVIAFTTLKSVSERHNKPNLYVIFLGACNFLRNFCSNNKNQSQNSFSYFSKKFSWFSFTASDTIRSLICCSLLQRKPAQQTQTQRSPFNTLIWRVFLLTTFLNSYILNPARRRKLSQKELRREEKKLCSFVLSVNCWNYNLMSVFIITFFAFQEGINLRDMSCAKVDFCLFLSRQLRLALDSRSLSI
jgi:hypothetical protein